MKTTSKIIKDKDSVKLHFGAPNVNMKNASNKIFIFVFPNGPRFQFRKTGGGGTFLENSIVALLESGQSEQGVFYPLK